MKFKKQFHWNKLQDLIKQSLTKRQAEGEYFLDFWKSHKFTTVYLTVNMKII